MLIKGSIDAMHLMYTTLQKHMHFTETNTSWISKIMSNQSLVWWSQSADGFLTLFRTNNGITS